MNVLLRPVRYASSSVGLSTIYADWFMDSKPRPPQGNKYSGAVSLAATPRLGALGATALSGRLAIAVTSALACRAAGTVTAGIVLRIGQ